MRQTLMAVGGALLLALAAAFTPAVADQRPLVVELFTSQGCSSCPPADALLAELARREDVLALGFHISYWDRLGWKDPLSSEASTNRQKAYASHLNGGQVYTPQMVVEGTRDLVGSDRAAVLQVLGEARPLAVASIRFADDRRSVAIGAGTGHGNVLLVRFLRQQTTDVSAGENAGRILRDANGVRSLATLGDWDGSARQFPVEPPAAGEGLAVLVQAADGKILGAGYITAPKTQGVNSSSPKPNSSLLVRRPEAVASTSSKILRPISATVASPSAIGPQSMSMSSSMRR